MEPHLQSLQLHAPSDEALYLWFEPWAEGLAFPPGTVIELQATSNAPGMLEIDQTHERTAIFGWSGCTLRALVNGQVVLSFDQPVPEGLDGKMVKMLFGAPPTPTQEERRLVEGARTEYRANLFAAGYFGHFVVGLVMLLLLVSIAGRAYGVALVASLISAATLLRIRARRMTFTAESFRYDGWMRSFEIARREIVRVAPAHSFGYPVDRLRGGQYCILMANGAKHWVSLLLFAGPGARKFHEEVVKANIAGS